RTELVWLSSTLADEHAYAARLTRLMDALHRLRAGDDLGTALAEPVRELASAAPGSRLNLLLTDGVSIAATAWGDSLWYLADAERRRTVVASEPYDDDTRWREVPDRTLLTATRTRVELTPLKENSL
ncbi:hypothetical protein AB0O33_38650, partial [Streptomyces sp. NPDC089795]